MKYLVPFTVESRAALVRLANLDSRNDALVPFPLAIPEEESVKHFGAALSRSGSSLAKTELAILKENLDEDNAVTSRLIGYAVGSNEPGKITPTHWQDDRSSDPSPVENLATWAGLAASSCSLASLPPQMVSDDTVLPPTEYARDEHAIETPLPIKVRDVAHRQLRLRFVAPSITAAVVLAALIGLSLSADTPALVKRYASSHDNAKTSLPNLPEVVPETLQERQISQKAVPPPGERPLGDRTKSDKSGAYNADDAPVTPPRSTEEERRPEALLDERAKTQRENNILDQPVGPASLGKMRPEIETRAAVASKGVTQATELTRPPKKAAAVNKKLRAERKRSPKDNDDADMQQRAKKLPREKVREEAYFPFRF